MAIRTIFVRSIKYKLRFIRNKIKRTTKMKRIKLWLAACCMLVVTTAAVAQDAAGLKKRVDPWMKYVSAQPDWLVSRLQMYWDTHATDVYIRGEQFERPGGGRAAGPTVKFNGTRGMEAAYDRPKLEDIVPYDDDKEGSVTYISRLTGKMEKAHPSKTGCNIAGVNRQILGIARDAALVYRLTGEKAYADLAVPVMRTFLLGLYYRNVPVDLNHGHQQTLVGMTTFEVIHEDAVDEVTEMYPVLRPLLGEEDRTKCDAALKKWAENIIANGVPHNNWNLFQADFIVKIALVLQDDADYADKRGRGYYLNYIVNESSVRQWSMKKMAEFGFDPYSKTWYESPGYSVTVLATFTGFADMLDEKAGIDLFEQIPALVEAVRKAPEYLFPNRMIVGFGDTHPGYLNVQMFDNILNYARRHGKSGLVAEMETLKRAVASDAPDAGVERHVSRLFHAPNVSWFVQRSGMNRNADLMVSLNGSLGNHQHANGLSMELYGKGYVLGPDAGIGKYLYSGLDYSEYYSQMPAHNTVVVDGVSSYPVMMSQHAFSVVDSAETDGLSYSVLAFREPETNAAQQRTTGIVKTNATGGYYVDVFRSRRNDGNDKTHDYFYHNLGQKMNVTGTNGVRLHMHPTDELAFAGGHLYAYSYIYDKLCTEMEDDVRTTFETVLDKPIDGYADTITMTMWMQYQPGRKIVRALSPVNLEYERMPNQPYNIESQPVLTFIARQRGEAWNRPFVTVYEPSSCKEPSQIASVDFFKPVSDDPSAVGIIVKLKDGRTDYIFSSAEGCSMKYGKMKVKGYYAVVSDDFTFNGK